MARYLIVLLTFRTSRDFFHVQTGWLSCATQSLRLCPQFFRLCNEDLLWKANGKERGWSKFCDSKLTFFTCTLLECILPANNVIYHAYNDSATVHTAKTFLERNPAVSSFLFCL